MPKLKKLHKKKQLIVRLRIVSKNCSKNTVKVSNTSIIVQIYE
jgi:hypothetical protein